MATHKVLAESERVRPAYVKALRPSQQSLNMQQNKLVALPLAQLSNPCELKSLIDLFSDLYPGCNRAAIVSQWSMSYFSVLLRGVIEPLLALDTAIDIFESCPMVLLENAEPVALELSSQPCLLMVGQQSKLAQRLIHDYLEPIVLALAKIGGIAPKVLWNNFVAVWNICLERTQYCLQQLTVCHGKIQLKKLQRMVESPVPELFSQMPVRTHCCLHYQLHAPIEGQFPVWCESCPKLHCRPLEEQACYLRQLHRENRKAVPN